MCNLDVYEVGNSTYAYYLKAPYKDHSPDFHVPFFTLVEFLCYMGWIKVAANLLNPYGDDDEDFKLNYLIDRNLQVIFFAHFSLANLQSILRAFK